MTPEYIGKLLFRHLRNELSAAEEGELSEWRGSSPRNERIFREQTDPDNIRRQVSDIYESRERVLKEIIERYPLPGGRPRKKHSTVYRILRVAAIFLVILGSGFYYLLYEWQNPKPGGSQAVFVSPEGVATAMDDFHRGFLAGSAGIRFDKDKNGDLIYIIPDQPHAAKDKYYKLYAARDGRLCLRLPDGSFIWLNSRSSIKYPANLYGDSARMLIEGEAYLELAARSVNPFRITARGMKMETTGARFDIKAYPNDSVSSITLIGGNLRISRNLKPGQVSSAVLLKPAQQFRMSADSSVILTNVDTAACMDWKNGRSVKLLK